MSDMCLFNFSNPGSILKKLLHTGNCLKVFLFDVFIFLFTLIVPKYITLPFSNISVFQIVRLCNFIYSPFNHIYCSPRFLNIRLQSFCCPNDLCKVTWRRCLCIFCLMLYFCQISVALSIEHVGFFFAREL